MTYQLFIGSNNQTKKLERDKIEAILSKRHEGYSLMPMTGHWQGKSEHSLLVIVSDDDYKVKKTISLLKSALDQEAIGYQIVPEMRFA